MNLKEYRILFIVIILGLTLIVASPVLAVFLPLQSGSEEFSEFWLLGPNHMAEGYPFNVSVGEEYRVFVGVGNHMSSSENYIVYVKLRNNTQSLADNNSLPSSMPPLYEYRFFIRVKEVWESLVTFGFEDAAVEGDVLSVVNFIINDVTFPVNISSRWIPAENSGFVFQLFFELWRYDVVSDTFRFDNRSVGLWLNMTASK